MPLPVLPRPLAFPTGGGWRRGGLVAGGGLLALLLAVAAPSRAADPLAGSRQLVTVVPADWNADAARLQAWQRDGPGRWQPAGAAFEVSIGRAGSAWGLGLLPVPEDATGPHKHEGDGRSSAGMFAIGTAFGYAAKIDSAMPYKPMQSDSYCIDVPTSPLYNTLVDAGTVGVEAVKGSTEPMRLDLHNHGDIRYREGFVIEQNPQAVPGRGSCIFAHLRRRPGEATAGCTAMEPANMQRLLAWLKPDAEPRFVLLPASEYRRLQPVWQLPTATPAP